MAHLPPISARSTVRLHDSEKSTAEHSTSSAVVAWGEGDENRGKKGRRKGEKGRYGRMKVERN